MIPVEKISHRKKIMKSMNFFPCFTLENDLNAFKLKKMVCQWLLPIRKCVHLIG